jgi:hypothetical protein
MSNQTLTIMDDLKKRLVDNGDGTFSEQVSAVTPGGFKDISVSFTRPADTTAYAQYDLVGPSTSAASAVVTLANAVRAAGEAMRVEKVALRCSDPLLKGKQIRVHIWRTAPTLSVGDNGAFNASDAGALAVADIAGYCGSVDITFDKAGTAGAKGFGVTTDGSPVYLAPSSGVDAYLTFEVRTSGGFTPVSGATFVAALWGSWA